MPNSRLNLHGDLVLEIYPWPADAGPADATTRLGSVVADVDMATEKLEAAGGTVATRPQRTEWGHRTIVRDPDGRAVELCQA